MNDEPAKPTFESLLNEFKSLAAGSSESEVQQLADKFAADNPEIDDLRDRLLRAFASSPSEMTAEATPVDEGPLAEDEPFEDLFPEDREYQISCPECGHDIRVVTQRSLEECDSCGNTVSLVDETAKKRVRVPKTIGPYQIIGFLGQGGYGRVYKGKLSDSLEHVAIKVPRLGQFDDDKHIRRFIREANTCKQLEHPNIVPIIDVNLERESPYIASQFIEGSTLRDAAIDQSLGIRYSVELLITVCHAIHHANQLGIIHRDIKPSNILIDVAGQPYVTDFGIARTLDADTTAMTLDGEILGTPCYMSPEQALGQPEQTDARTDVYSLGATLYRLVARKLPFNGNPRDLIKRIPTEPLTAPRVLNHQVPIDVDTIIQKAMEKRPERRYDTAADLADDLQRWLDGKPIYARRKSMVTRAYDWTERNRQTALILATTALSLLLICGMYISSSLNQAQANARLEKERIEGTLKTIASLTTNGIAKAEASELGSAIAFFAEASRLGRIENIPLHGQAANRRRLEKSLRFHPKLLYLREFEDTIQNIKLQDEDVFVTTAEQNFYGFNWKSKNELFPSKELDFRIMRTLVTADRVFACSNPETPIVHIYERQTGLLVKSIRVNSNIWSFSLSPDESLIAIGTQEGEVSIWNTSDGSLVVRRQLPPFASKEETPDGYKSLVVSVSISPDNSKIAVVVSYAQLAGGKLAILEIADLEDTIVTYSDPKFFQVAYDDESVLWTIQLDRTDIQPGDSISNFDDGRPRKLASIDDQGNSLAEISLDSVRIFEPVRISPTESGQRFYFETRENIEVVSLVDGKMSKNSTALTTISDLDVDEQNKLCLTCQYNGQVRVFDARTLASLNFPLDIGSTHANSRVLNQTQLLTANDDGEIIHWDAANLGPDEIETIDGEISSLQFSPDDKYLLACSAKQQLVWRIEPNGLQVELELNDEIDAANNCEFSKDGSRLAIVGEDRIRVYDCSDSYRESTSVTLSSAGTLVKLKLEPNGQALAIGYSNGIVELWALDESQPQLVDRFELSNNISALEFSSDGSLLAFGDVKGNFRTVDSNSGRILGSNSLLKYPVLIHFFAKHSEEQVVLVSQDGAPLSLFKIGETGDLKLLQEVQFDSRVKVLQLTDGATLVVEANGTVTRFAGLPGLSTTDWLFERSNWRLSYAGISEERGSLHIRYLIDGKYYLAEIDLRDGELLGPPIKLCNTSSVYGSFAASADGSLFATGDDVGNINLWDFSPIDIPDEQLEELALLTTGQYVNSDQRVSRLDVSQRNERIEALRTLAPSLFEPASDKQSENFLKYIQQPAK